MTGDAVVHADPTVLAEAVAARLLVRLSDVQAARGQASLVLTGGRIADAVYRALAASPARHAVDWARVTLWWGDERFLPDGHPERNDTQAEEALAPLPLEASRVHRMPSSDGPDGTDPEAAAARYAHELAVAGNPGELPHFDVLLLGVGEDGHVASIFPDHPAAYEAGAVCAVRGAPKPPPVRLSLTLPAIRQAEQVWLIAAGPDKAGAVKLAFHGDGHGHGHGDVPAGGVRGVDRTLWLLDRAAAAYTGRRSSEAGQLDP